MKFTPTDRKSGAKHSPPAFPNFSEGLPEGNLEVPDRRTDFVTSLVRFKVFESIFSEALGSTRNGRSMPRPMHLSFLTKSFVDSGFQLSSFFPWPSGVARGPFGTTST